MPYSPNSDWRTSKNNIAPDAHWSGTDDTYNIRAQLKAMVEKNYPGAAVVRDATRTYNCHAYVHAQRHAWFNDIAPFLNDDYYPFTPGQLQLNDAVVYVKDAQITHSGFIIQLNGNQIIKVRSKWGAWPEVEHPPTSVPTVYGSIVYYLRRRSGAMIESELLDKELSNRIDDLIYQLTNDDAIAEYLLASTPAVAEAIVRSKAAFQELTLFGRAGSKHVAQRLQETRGAALLPLALAVAENPTPEGKKGLARAFLAMNEGERQSTEGFAISATMHRLATAQHPGRSEDAIIGFAKSIIAND